MAHEKIAVRGLAPYMHRLPDFIIIGAMKAGTTTLFQWLSDHPQCSLPPVKEPHFFSRDSEFARGAAHYLRNFGSIASALVTGEASVSYADPRIASQVTKRIHALVPDVRLIYVVRDPGLRLKSHYLHEWQRSRERRPLVDAISEPDNAYVALSRYADAVLPFVDTFGLESVLLVHLEDLDGPDAAGWLRVAQYLGLDPCPGPSGRANETRSKVPFNRLALRLWELGWLDGASSLPRPVRKWGRALIRRRGSEFADAALATDQVELPTHIRDQLSEQWIALHHMFGVPPRALPGQERQ